MEAVSGKCTTGLISLLFGEELATIAGGEEVNVVGGGGKGKGSKVGGILSNGGEFWLGFDDGGGEGVEGEMLLFMFGADVVSVDMFVSTLVFPYGNILLKNSMLINVVEKHLLLLCP